MYVLAAGAISWLFLSVHMLQGQVSIAQRDISNILNDDEKIRETIDCLATGPCGDRYKGSWAERDFSKVYDRFDRQDEKIESLRREFDLKLENHCNGCSKTGNGK